VQTYREGYAALRSAGLPMELLADEEDSLLPQAQPTYFNGQGRTLGGVGGSSRGSPPREGGVANGASPQQLGHKKSRSGNGTEMELGPPGRALGGNGTGTSRLVL
jgi:hypothetical protein